MRVIAGEARRLTLKSVPGFDTRPTVDRIKETVFNILNPYIPGSAFLDLFSGSGGIGIEALSRGARISVFVETSSKAVKCIEENLAFTKLADRAIVLKKTAVSAIHELSLKNHHFDIVYMDPPYAKGLEEETLRALEESGIIDEDTLIVIEADKRNTLPFLEKMPFSIIREKEYKNNKHYFLKLDKDKS